MIQFGVYGILKRFTETFDNPFEMTRKPINASTNHEPKVAKTWRAFTVFLAGAGAGDFCFFCSCYLYTYIRRMPVCKLVSVCACSTACTGLVCRFYAFIFSCKLLTIRPFQKSNTS